MISRIERGESSPTASLLGKLSGALEVTMSQLLAPASSTWTDPGTGYRRRAVTTADDFGFDVTEVVLPPGTAQTFPASAYSFNRHLIWVADGELAFTEGELRHVLGSGDSLRLGLPAECTFANETSSPCRYLVMVAPSP
ncbi:helix-turn-helix domain-containing protein [soil metagenome]